MWALSRQGQCKCSGDTRHVFVMDGGSAHGEIFSSLVMNLNAGHVQKCTRGQSGLYPSNHLQFSPDYSGMFPGPSPVVPLLHFFSGCSQQVSLNSLEAEHILSAAALYF